MCGSGDSGDVITLYAEIDGEMMRFLCKDCLFKAVQNGKLVMEALNQCEGCGEDAAQYCEECAGPHCTTCGGAGPYGEVFCRGCAPQDEELTCQNCGDQTSFVFCEDCYFGTCEDCGGGRAEYCSECSGSSCEECGSTYELYCPDHSGSSCENCYENDASLCYSCSNNCEECGDEKSSYCNKCSDEIEVGRWGDKPKAEPAMALVAEPYESSDDGSRIVSGDVEANWAEF